MQKTLIKDELATLRTLKRARRLIAKEENWCQGPYARTARGRECEPKSKSACSWCSVGALLAASDGIGVYRGPVVALEAVLPSTTDFTGWRWQPGLGQYNDAPGRTHKQVMSVWDRAIRTVERRIERMRARRSRG